jgi:hypothetical protein
MAESAKAGETGHPVLAATPARQGRLGRDMFWVLVISTILAAIGLGLAWLWKAPAMSVEDARRAAPPPQQAAQPPPRTP